MKRLQWADVAPAQAPARQAPAVYRSRVDGPQLRARLLADGVLREGGALSVCFTRPTVLLDDAAIIDSARTIFAVLDRAQLPTVCQRCDPRVAARLQLLMARNAPQQGVAA